MNISNLLPGFLNPVFDSQLTFRQVLTAMAHPGRVNSLRLNLRPPSPLQTATAAVCLTLLDLETPLWIDFDHNSDAARWLGFHLGCPLVGSPASASFAVITQGHRIPALGLFNTGQDDCPEKSATLIIQVPGLISGSGKCLTGPGINTVQLVDVLGLPHDFWKTWKLNNALYPRGVDILFTAGSSLVGLPRTTEVED